MEVPAVPPSERLRHRARVRTRWSDEDNHGVLNNAVYLTLMEEARHSYFDALGLMRGARFPFVLAQVNTLFLRPGRGAAWVEVEVGTLSLGTSSFVQAFRVLEPDAGGPWCEAVARLVAVDERGERRPLPEELRRRIAEFEGLSAPPR